VDAHQPADTPAATQKVERLRARLAGIARLPTSAASLELHARTSPEDRESYLR
jgi:hypothetical protein